MIRAPDSDFNNYSVFKMGNPRSLSLRHEDVALAQSIHQDICNLAGLYQDDDIERRKELYQWHVVNALWLIFKWRVCCNPNSKDIKSPWVHRRSSHADRGGPLVIAFSVTIKCEFLFTVLPLYANCDFGKGGSMDIGDLKSFERTRGILGMQSDAELNEATVHFLKILQWRLHGPRDFYDYYCWIQNQSSI